jgi:phosphohistidine phosphatase
MFRQSTVIPCRHGPNGLEVLLVTSRRTKRWVPPKGIVERGMSAAESAAKEALEEAGVEGLIDDHPLGTYQYEKWRGTCTVEVYAMEVRKELPDWPEASVRTREWMSADEAARRVDEEALKEILKSLPDRSASHTKAP